MMSVGLNNHTLVRFSGLLFFFLEKSLIHSYKGIYIFKHIYFFLNLKLYHSSGLL